MASAFMQCLRKWFCADPAFKLLFLKLTPQDPALGPAPSAASSLPPSVAPRPASVPGPGIPNKSSGNATIEIRVSIQWRNIGAKEGHSMVMQVDLKADLTPQVIQQLRCPRGFGLKR